MVDLRLMMATFPTGVGVVTTVAGDGRPWGMTCTSLASVTLDPPSLLLCLRGGSPTLTAILQSRGFALNLLQDDARETAELFASGDPDRFQQVRWSVGSGARGPHLLDAAHTVADCTLVRHTVVGSHTVVFGEVTALTQHGDARPLLYGMRTFAKWPDPAYLS